MPVLDLLPLTRPVMSYTAVENVKGWSEHRAVWRVVCVLAELAGYLSAHRQDTAVHLSYFFLNASTCESSQCHCSVHVMVWVSVHPPVSSRYMSDTLLIATSLNILPSIDGESGMSRACLSTKDRCTEAGGSVTIGCLGGA